MLILSFTEKELTMQEKFLIILISVPQLHKGGFLHIL